MHVEAGGADVTAQAATWRDLGLLTTHEAAAFLEVSPAAVLKLVQRGRLLGLERGDTAGRPASATPCAARTSDDAGGRAYPREDTAGPDKPDTAPDTAAARSRVHRSTRSALAPVR